MPRALRFCFWAFTAIALGYAVQGVVANDLLVPGPHSRFGSPVGPLRLHNPAALVALTAVACWCLALRAVIIDRFVRFGDDARLRYRASTFALILLAFALLFAAMALQFQADVALLRTAPMGGPHAAPPG